MYGVKLAQHQLRISAAATAYLIFLKEQILSFQSGMLTVVSRQRVR